MKNVRYLVLVLLICLLTIQFVGVGTAFADPAGPGIGGQPLGPGGEGGQPPEPPEEPPKEPPEFPYWQQSETVDSNVSEQQEETSEDSNLWLYVGIGAGVVVLAVGSVFVVKAIKRKKQQW